MRKIRIEANNISKNYVGVSEFSMGLKRFSINPIKNFKKVRHPFSVLKDVSLSIKEGECVGLIGKNGAGKSTLLGILAGIINPTLGTINHNGSIAAMLELGTGMHPELTGRENIILNGILIGFRKDQIYDLIDDIIKFSELEEFIDNPIRTYSSGMLAKLGFSIMIYRNPDVLVLDEVFAVGDLGFQEKCKEAINSFMQCPSKSLIFVSHDLTSVKNMCQRGIWIDDGKMVFDGHVDEAVDAYVASF